MHIPVAPKNLSLWKMMDNSLIFQQIGLHLPEAGLPVNRPEMIKKLVGKLYLKT
jgi:hypothetical protein